MDHTKFSTPSKIPIFQQHNLLRSLRSSTISLPCTHQYTSVRGSLFALLLFSVVRDKTGSKEYPDKDMYRRGKRLDIIQASPDARDDEQLVRYHYCRVCVQLIFSNWKTAQRIAELNRRQDLRW
jgi:hypothetical protein